MSFSENSHGVFPSVHAPELTSSGQGDDGVQRLALVRRGLLLNYASIAVSSLEAMVSLIAGIAAGSVALVGFGADSLIEVTSSLAAQWRLRTDHDALRREGVEFRTTRIIGWCFVGLGLYIVLSSSRTLLHRSRPDENVWGVAVLVMSMILMPIIARQKRKVAVAMGSGALGADATQTSLCAYLSAIALLGILLNAFVGWWWADPVAALAMVPIIVKEGLEGVRGEAPCADCL